MRYICSCCGYYTLREESDDICQVCCWQEYIAQKEDPDYIGGPNEDVSLNQARKNYNTFGAFHKNFINKKRNPFDEELPENNQN